MPREMFCPNCNRNVLTKKYDWVALTIVFIAIIILRSPFLIAVFLGMLVYCMVRKPRCKECGRPIDKSAPDYYQPNPYQADPYQTQNNSNASAQMFCGSCGQRLNGGSFCPNCGRRF